LSASLRHLAADYKTSISPPVITLTLFVFAVCYVSSQPWQGAVDGSKYGYAA
jgi:hypothetical protein